MKQVNGEVRLLIIMTLLFVFLVPVGFLVITTSSDQHNQDDILDTGGAVDSEEQHNTLDVEDDEGTDTVNGDGAAETDGAEAEDTDAASSENSSADDGDATGVDDPAPELN